MEKKTDNCAMNTDKTLKPPGVPKLFFSYWRGNTSKLRRVGTKLERRDLPTDESHSPGDLLANVSF